MVHVVVKPTGPFPEALRRKILVMIEHHYLTGISAGGRNQD
jgi:hypothetical protein